MKKKSGYVLLNVADLAIGLTGFLLIALIVIHELSYNRSGRGGDHSHFCVQDFPAVVNLAAVTNLALAPCEPLNCGIVVSGLTNTSTLKWEAPTQGQKPAGYYILVRETWQPLWEKKIYVTWTEVILPYSKDNYFFRIQSVSASGHESPEVFPGQAGRSVSRNPADR